MLKGLSWVSRQLGGRTEYDESDASMYAAFLDEIFQKPVFLEENGSEIRPWGCVM